MKITAQIDISPSEYFKHLCDTMISDIKKHTRKDITMSELIDGYKYERKIAYKKKGTHIIITIGPLIKDKYYFVKYETNDTLGQYYYDFSSNDGNNYVTYFEETKYKKETVGTYLGNIRKKIMEKSTALKALQNIDLTITYIKNHRK